MKTENQKLIEMFRTSSMDMSQDEIELLLDEEFKKDYEHIDTALIDRCAEALTGADEAPKKKRRGHVYNFRKILLIAAVIAAICTITSLAYARNLRMDADPEFVKYVDGHFVVNLPGDKEEPTTIKSSDIIPTLKESCFENVVLPQALLSDAWSVTEVDVDTSSPANPHCSLELVNADGSTVVVSLLEVGEQADSFGDINLAKSYIYAEQVKCGDIDILIFGNDNDCEIMYIADSVMYSLIFTDIQMDEAKELAGTVSEG